MELGLQPIRGIRPPFPRVKGPIEFTPAGQASLARPDCDLNATKLDFTQNSRAALTETDSPENGPDFQEEAIPLLQFIGFR